MLRCAGVTAALLLGASLAKASSPLVAEGAQRCVARESWFGDDGSLNCPEILPDGRLNCQLIFRALDYRPFISYGFALLVTFTLREMQQQGFEDSSDNDSSENRTDNDNIRFQHLCWSLDSIEVTRVKDASEVDWNHERHYLYSFGIYLLLTARTFHVTANYPPGTPAVTTMIDAKCWETHRRPYCITSAHVSTDVLMPDFDVQHLQYNPYHDIYWNDVKEMHIKNLKAENITMHLKYDSKNGTSLDSTHYIQPLIKDVPLQSLHLINVNLLHIHMGEQGKMLDLKLSGSELNSDDAGWLISSMPNLQNLSLAFNNLTTLPQAISELKNLRNLDLSHNAIKMSSTVLSSLSNLKWLNLAGNPLNDLSAFLKYLNNDVQLLFLNVSLCSFSELETVVGSNALRHQTKLQVIDMSYNALLSLPHDIFSGMIHLNVLNLSHNNFTKHLRLHLPHNGIKLLDLSYNYFESPESIVESGVSESVLLKGNKIKYWNNSHIFLKAFNSDGAWLSKIDLSDCKINAVTEEMQISFQYLKEIDLGGNPFDCSDCSMPLFKHWLQSKYDAPAETHSKLLNYGRRESFSCAHPQELAGMPILSAEDNPYCQSSYSLVIGIPLLTILALAACTTIALYFYRYEITYILHLVKIRKMRLANSEIAKHFRYDAFVCYSGKDRNFVTKKLVPQLENGSERYRVCLHERDFILGSIISRNIASFMQESKNTVVVLTSNFVNSQVVLLLIG